VRTTSDWYHWIRKAISVKHCHATSSAKPPVRFSFLSFLRKSVSILMQWFRLRPTFEIPLTLGRAEAMKRIQTHYDRLCPTSSMFLHGEYGEFHLPRAEHRLWSPHLSFYVQEEGEQGLIHGRFAPRLEVWTFVWVIYLAMAFSAFFGLALGYSQWSLGGTAWGGWIAAVAIAVILALYGIASVGQQLSSDQMDTLRQRLDGFLLDAEIERRE